MIWLDPDFWGFGVLAVSLASLSLTFLITFIRLRIKVALGIALILGFWSFENFYWSSTFLDRYPIFNEQFPWYGYLLTLTALWTNYELYRRHFKDD